MSSWFVSDLLLEREDAKAKHIIQALGSSSMEKAVHFKECHCQNTEAKPYATYEDVYNDPDVDIVYIGTPHHLHKQNCLDSIKAGKHVLCEKPFTANIKETLEVIEAAKKKNVFLMEG